MAVGNSIRDEIKEQQKKVLQEQGIQGRLSYFFYYYKLQLLIAVLAIIAVLFTIYFYLNKKDIVLRVVYINGFPNVETEVIADDFASSLPDFNADKQEVLIDDSFYISQENRTQFDDTNEQKLILMITGGEIDGCVTDKSYLDIFMNNAYLLDLRTVLTDEQMKKYEDLFIYDTNKVPVAICISDAPSIVETNSYPNGDCYYCIFSNSKNITNAADFFHYLEDK